MTNTSLDLNQFHAELNGAAAALRAFTQVDARAASDELGATFERAGNRIAVALGRAARDGEGSFKRMAKVILEELAKIALKDLMAATPSAPFFGARAGGGAVNAGGAYLVGERGPEWFVPRQAGHIATGASAPVAVHIHLAGGGDGAAIVRHQGQIAAAVARAVAYGRRNL